MNSDANRLKYQLEMRDIRAKRIKELEEENRKLRAENLSLQISEELYKPKPKKG